MLGWLLFVGVLVSLALPAGAEAGEERSDGGRARGEKENWVWKGANFLRPSCKRGLLFLSRGGADAIVVREFDLTTRTFVKNGFTLPEAKSNIDWRDRNNLFVGTDFGPGSLTES